MSTERALSKKPRARASIPAPTRWTVAKATGGCTVVEKWGAKGLVDRFTFRNDDGDAERLAKLLNRIDRAKPRGPASTSRQGAAVSVAK